MAGSRFVDVWINCPDRAVAEAIAEACVGRGLAACANILPPMGSIYRWKGRIERADEVPLVLKTRAELFERLCETVGEHHPYEVPSIVATELQLVVPRYAAWLEEETSGSGQSRR